MSENKEILEENTKLEDLKELKTKALVGIDCFLKDDILKNNLLLLKKGVYLDDKTIDKLINFGVKQAMVKLETKNRNKFHTIDKINDVKTQRILIFQKTFTEISKVIKEFLNAGISQNCLYVTTDLNVLERYILDKNVKYVFADASLYNAKFEIIINQKTDLDVFLINCNGNSTIRSAAAENVKRIYNPLSANVIKFLLSNSSNNRYGKLSIKRSKF